MSFGLTDQVLIKIKSIIYSFSEVEEAILFGSRAKGNYKNGSDIDISLKGEKINNVILNTILNRLDELNVPFEFDVCIYHQIKNNQLKEHIDRVGIHLITNEN